jgi:tetratricopeptide (TPR) repeat protein
MKLFIFFLLACSSLAGYAQSDKYVAAMKKNFELLDSAKTTQDYQTAANTFERIGDAEKTQWLPYYYAGLSLVLSGWSDTRLDKDANAARVNALCDKAEAFEKNAEIYMLRNMAATQQMMVDPQTRWQTYGQQASGYLQKAMEIDPNNPRIYYLKGQSVFNTPVAFGGGKDNAKPLFEKSVDLFKKEQPKPLYPRWGKDQAEMMLAKCQ